MGIKLATQNPPKDGREASHFSLRTVNSYHWKNKDELSKTEPETVS